MCGIAGFSWCDEHLIKRMTDAIRHRGPDDEGAYTNAELSFGHRRLSILDLSQLGRQPMAYEREGRHAVVTFNGEIYNFHHIRRELESRGYRFNTGTDTEVIPAAYLEWGLECVERFNGMWAFALYDPTRKQIVLSRDRFGEKPLYYRLHDHKLIFASEIKAILEHPIPRRANQEAVSDYLFSGIANQGKDTFFEGIHMLPPAHNAIFYLQTGRLALHKYYEPRLGNRQVTADEFHDALRKSVSSRLISDVPISVSLSSGIDSTSVAALIAESTTSSVKAFTTTAEETLGDESELIEHFLDQYPQFELEKANLSEASFCKHYREIIFHMDEPFARQSAYVRWEIANLTRQHGRKVLLNGEGADEILGGYMAFAPHFLEHLARHFMLIRFSRELYATLRHPERTNIIQAFRSGVLFKSAHLERQEAAAATKREKFHIGLKPIQRPNHRFKDIKDYLGSLVRESSLPRLLNCNDKMTMANSVEARAPFLDHEFVDLAFSMDPSQLVVGGRRKYPLRQAMRGRVPDEILFRKNKDAFNAPIFEYLRSGSIRQRVKEIFADARTCVIFSPKAYLEEYDRFLARRGADRAFLLHGLFLEEWARIFEVDFS
jgi:asparagine synthase (glutamine-hydrolysing)